MGKLVNLSYRSASHLCLELAVVGEEPDVFVFSQEGGQLEAFND